MHDHNLDDLIIDNIEPKHSRIKSFLTIVALLIVVLIVAIILTKILLKTPHNTQLSFEENTTDLIAPELKLKETPEQVKTNTEPVLSNIVESRPKPAVAEEIKPDIVKEPVKEVDAVVKKVDPTPEVEPKVLEIKKDPVLSNITEQEVKAPVLAKEISTADQEEKDAADRAYWESVQAKRKAEQEAREKAENKAKEALQAQKAAEAKKLKTPVVKKPEPIAKPEEKVVTQKPVPASTSSTKYYIQVGSFKNQPSSRFISVIRNNGFKYRILRSPKDGTKKLLIGPYEDRASVNHALVQVKDRINKSAFVVKR